PVVGWLACGVGVACPGFEDGVGLEPGPDRPATSAAPRSQMRNPSAAPFRLARWPTTPVIRRRSPTWIPDGATPAEAPAAARDRASHGLGADGEVAARRPHRRGCDGTFDDDQLGFDALTDARRIDGDRLGNVAGGDGPERAEPAELGLAIRVRDGAAHLDHR